MLTHNALFERMFFKLLLAKDKYPLTGAKTCRGFVLVNVWPSTKQEPGTVRHAVRPLTG